ncbi:hypothetical protein LTR56_007676 [Elasticomyces elasticus]|nr:hypothetical protein LTR56_007676 [Elasticomyces elasticus]KAK3661952.1 hypothetical protein LTR22_007326 [Elasticomyces elasticus]KAK5759813.1 hypothetical protein LTS12_010000 [Elasticomyces elasticus]
MAVVTGILWTLRPFDGLSACAGQICKLLAFTDDNIEVTYSPAQRDGLLQLLLKQLFDIGCIDIIELIVTSVLQRQLHSPVEIYTILRALQSWMYHGHSWPGEALSSGMLETYGSSIRQSDPK